jgi:hypothetical protein
MNPAVYHLLWLLVALGAIAALSAAITRQKRHHDERRRQALQLAQALQRYSDWVLTQRLMALFQGENAAARAALDEACTLRLAWFPELAADMAELLAVHNRLIAFLTAQRGLWLRDPENWLASEHDKHFMMLWREHRFTVQALLAKLQQLARMREAARPARQSTYA